MSTTTTITPTSGPTSRIEHAIEAQGLVKRFGDTLAVDRIDLTVPRGLVYGVLGPNGAGKTTMLSMLATLLSIDEGEARVFGVDVAREPHVVRQLVGLTGQYASVDENLTGRENLWLFARLQGLPSRVAKQRALDLLERFGLTDASDKQIHQYSGGMRRRLDLAASLIMSPPLIFLDEPTTGLDPRTRGQMWETIRDLVANGCTVLLTTQYLDEADQLADRIAVIDRGRLVAEGTSDELKSSVGESSLQITLADHSRLPEAAELVARTLGAHPVLTPETGRLVVPLARPDAALDALVDLRSADIAVAELNVAKPSLDEVFLALTGHSTGIDDPDADDVHPDGGPR